MSSLIADNRLLEMASYGSGDSGGICYAVGNLSVGEDECGRKPLHIVVHESHGHPVSRDGRR